MTTLGIIFAPDRPPEELLAAARAAEAAGVEQLWLWEDCFFESGVASAAAVLASTERLTVGIGLLPVPLRNVAIAAMELATLERLFPGRVVPGIGHGVLDWMGQVGARAASPMTLLREYTVALRALLHGERVTTSGRYVQLDGVRLDYPPTPAPPLLVGAVKAKTLALAGELADGVILTGDTSPAQLREAMAPYTKARPAGADAGAAVVFMPVTDLPPADEVAAGIAERVAAGATHVSLLSVGDEPPTFERFAAFVAQQVAPLVV